MGTLFSFEIDENVLKLDTGDGGSMLCTCTNCISIKLLFFFK